MDRCREEIWAEHETSMASNLLKKTQEARTIPRLLENPREVLRHPSADAQHTEQLTLNEQWDAGAGRDRTDVLCMSIRNRGRWWITNGGAALLPPFGARTLYGVMV